MTDTLRVGVIGIGVMGTAISTRLLDVGQTVVIHDRNDHKMAPIVDKGATAAANPVALAAQVDFIITSLNSADGIEGVLFGEDGAASAGSADKMLIDMSSIDPKATVALAERLNVETGMDWVDSPLSGGAPAALEGKMTLMLGGEETAVARARQVLDHLGANITHMGPIGAGQTTKLINQVLCACNFLSVAEATRLALDAGIDATKVPSALAGGRADSRVLQEFMGKMAVYDYSPTGRLDNMLKDLEAVERFASATRTPMPVTGLVTELHRLLVMAGFGPDDNAAYMKLFDFGRGASAGN